LVSASSKVVTLPTHSRRSITLYGQGGE
jgi:hypothetical protein